MWGKFDLEGFEDGKIKFHLIDWNLVCSPINYGGLGMREVTSFNNFSGGGHFWRLVIGIQYKKTCGD